MVNIRRAQHMLIIAVVVLFVISVSLIVIAGVGLRPAVIDSTFDALDVGYSVLQFSVVSNPLLLTSKLLSTLILPLLTAVLATWFFDFINNINIMEKYIISKIGRLKGNHVIVVSYNSFAKTLLKELKKNNISTVMIVDTKKELVRLYREGELAVYGDIRSMDVFEIAKIGNASCVVACSTDDIQNALISITAKTANPDITIISRVNKEENTDRLKTAGAKITILPETTAGIEIGNELTKRALEDKFRSK
jgi:voltage-gated potassium channel Kch